MEVISFRCAACKQVLKIGADKAGRKAKCKCGADVVIPSASEPAGPAPAPPPIPAKSPFDDDDDGTYGLIGDFSTGPSEEEKAKQDKQDDADKKQKATEAVGRRHKTTRARSLLNPEKWQKVCQGLNIVAIGLWIWCGAALLREIPMVIGLFNAPDYARVRLRWENPQVYAQLAKEGTPDQVAISKPEFMLGLMSGDPALTAGLWLCRIAAILLLGAGLTMVVGYGFCLPVPPRFGTKGQALTLLILGSLNIIFTVVFRLLPAFGVMDYALVPVLAPEVALIDGNLEREVPLPVLLSPLPMLDYLLSLVVLGTFFLEPVVIGIFVRSIALSMRDEKLQERGDGMIRLGLGSAFVWLSYMMIMVTGSSDVLLWLLRLVYLLGLGFFLGQLAWFAYAVQQTPPMIQKEMDMDEAGAPRPVPAGGGREEDDEDEDDDEEDDDED